MDIFLLKCTDARNMKASMKILSLLKSKLSSEEFGESQVFYCFHPYNFAFIWYTFYFTGLKIDLFLLKCTYSLNYNVSSNHFFFLVIRQRFHLFRWESRNCIVVLITLFTRKFVDAWNGCHLFSVNINIILV